MFIFWILRRQDFDHLLSKRDMSKELKNPSRVQKPDAKVPPYTHKEKPDEESDSGREKFAPQGCHASIRSIFFCRISFKF